MSSASPSLLDPQQVIFLPRWAKWIITLMLILIGVSACLAAVYFLFQEKKYDLVVPVMSIAQTAIGACAIIIFVFYSEKVFSSKRLNEKTNYFLYAQLIDALNRIEIPQIEKNKTIQAQVIKRENTIYGGRKDIFGSVYELSLLSFKLRMWAGLNVRRLSVIYFIPVQVEADVDFIKEVFRHTCLGAEGVGYRTTFEYVEIEGHRMVSLWASVAVEAAILGNPAEQLFWAQDIAMMTQSLARAAVRHGISVSCEVEPGPI